MTYSLHYNLTKEEKDTLIYAYRILGGIMDGMSEGDSLYADDERWEYEYVAIAHSLLTDLGNTKNLISENRKGK